MPVPRAPQLSVADDEQRHLESIVRAHSTPQALSFRCQLILRAAAADQSRSQAVEPGARGAPDRAAAPARVSSSWPGPPRCAG